MANSSPHSRSRNSSDEGKQKKSPAKVAPSDAAAGTANLAPFMVPFKANHNECQGTIPSDSITADNSGDAPEDMVEPGSTCDEVEGEVEVDLATITVRVLESGISDQLDPDTEHGFPYSAPMDVLIDSITLVWDEAGKPDCTTVGLSDEGLRVVLGELRAGGCKGHLSIWWSY